MGDGTDSALCRRFIEEFQRDLEPLFRIDCPNIVEQYFGYDLEFNVRWAVELRDRKGETHKLWSQDIVYFAGMEESDLYEALADVLLEKDPSYEAMQALERRVARIYE